jgi:hypothetical protein
MPAKKMKNPPETEFVLIFFGGLLIVADSILGPITNLGFGAAGLLAQYFEFFGILIGLLIVVCAIMIYSTEGRTRRMFATGALIFGIMSLLAGGGFLSGFFLAMIGSLFILIKKG